MPAMSDDGFRLALDGIETLLSAGGTTEGTVSLAYVAAQLLALDEAELTAARRRAMFVLAAGGDPHRELDPHSPAVASLARDLDSPALRADLVRTLGALAEPGRPATSAAINELLTHEDLALRMLAKSPSAPDTGLALSAQTSTSPASREPSVARLAAQCETGLKQELEAGALECHRSLSAACPSVR